MHPATPHGPIHGPRDPETHASEELRDDSFHLLVDSVRDYAIFMLDTAGKIISWNKGAERIKGYTAAEALGKSFTIFYRSEDIAAGKPQQALKMAITQGSFAEEGLRVRRDGRQFWANVMITAVKDQNGVLRGFGKVTRDITLSKQSADDLKALACQLARSNKELEQFAYIASHDLQEPLRKIQAFANYLKAEYEDKLTGDGLFYIDRMDAAAQRMRQLIEDLLSYSRLSYQPEKALPIDLNQLVSEVLGDLETNITEQQARITISPLPQLEGDPLLLRQLFHNLIGNALKFHRRGEAPRIEVHASPCRLEVTDADGHEEQVEGYELVVRDHGIGFDEKYKETIFSLFQRLHPRGEFDGTGLGLAICRKIVERHAGHITAAGCPDKGARFVVTLPSQAHYLRHEKRSDSLPRHREGGSL